MGNPSLQEDSGLYWEGDAGHLEAHMSVELAKKEIKNLSEPGAQVWAAWYQALEAVDDEKAKRVAGSAARLWESGATTKWAIRNLVEVGRVLSRANETKLRKALEAIEEVLGSLKETPEPVEESTSFRAVEDAVRRALKIKYGKDCWLVDMFDDAAVFELQQAVGPESAVTSTWRIGYKYTKPDTVEFDGEAEKVKRVVSWEPIEEAPVTKKAAEKVSESKEQPAVMAELVEIHEAISAILLTEQGEGEEAAIDDEWDEIPDDDDEMDEEVADERELLTAIEQMG